MEITNEARNFAIRKHAGQKYGDKKYIYHLDQVMEIVKNYRTDCRILAYLHDTVEDTNTTLEEIQINFGVELAYLTFLITDEEGSNRKERKERTYSKVEEVKSLKVNFEELFIVKAADRLANLRECILEDNLKLLNMYKKEHEEFKSVYYVKDLCEEIWNEIDEIVGG